MEEHYDLLKIGLTEGEAKVYIALSKLGSSTVGPIVKDSRVAYSNVYEILNRLIEKGIVSFIIKEKTKYFQAAPPSNLLEYLDKKESKLKEQKNSLKKIIPDLEELQEQKEDQEAEVFLGVKGLRTAYEKLYKKASKKSEVLFFYIHEEEYAEESNLFYNSVIDIIKKLPTRAICNKEYRKSWFAKKAKYIKIKFVDIPIPGNIDILGNNVLIVSWKPSVVGILINSESISRAMRDYFEDVWKGVR